VRTVVVLSSSTTVCAELFNDNILQLDVFVMDLYTLSEAGHGLAER
jgi:hypothetical protein